MSVLVNIDNGVFINEMTSNNSVSSGENNQFGWHSHQKRTYIYNCTGHYYYLDGNTSEIIDNDYIDFYSYQDTEMQGFTSQSL